MRGRRATGSVVACACADRGPGIAAEEQERIFERFVRGSARGRDAAPRGSGIGLALVKHIAESHGGAVRVTSPLTEDGRGTAFDIVIPATARDAPQAEPRA